MHYPVSIELTLKRLRHELSDALFDGGDVAGVEAKIARLEWLWAHGERWDVEF